MGREKIVEKQPLKDVVYQALRKDILSGEISGGTHITESGISKRLGVSRTPVREALQRLTQEKLVSALHRAGYIVEDMSNEDIQDIFLARFEIEALVVKKAVNHITDPELERLKHNIKTTKTYIHSANLEKVTQMDLEFHAILYRAARSKTYYRICTNLGELTMKYRHGLNLEKGLWDKALQHHQMIYDALLKKDKNAAVNAMLAHGEQARIQLLDMMQMVRSELFANDDIS